METLAFLFYFLLSVFGLIIVIATILMIGLTKIIGALLNAIFNIPGQIRRGRRGR